MSQGQGLVSINMTSFFKRKLFMYSIGDIRFKKPIALKKVGYITAAFIIWTIPILVIFGINLNVWYALFVIAPPIIFGHYASEPKFGGMTLIGWLKNAFEFMTTPKGWSDSGPVHEVDCKGSFKVDNEIWISRRRELQILADLREEKLKKESDESGN